MKLLPRSAEEPEVNLTSLIDVVLLLLVFFMVSTSFERESELRIQLPQADVSDAATPPADAIEIMITEQGGYLVNEVALVNARPITLRQAIRSVVGDERDLPVTIRADANAKHQHVVTAMDVVGRLGFVNVNIATTNQEQ
ncbi:MAG: ExbD/TolR family protein [Gammaproteobacteria bacterium]